MDGARPVQESVDQNLVVLAAAAILRNDKILVVREEDKPYNGQWVLPQGYPKRNEALSDAARREASEELGMEIEVLGLVGVYDDFVRENDTTVHFIIACYLGRPSREARVKSTSEVIDSAWIDPSEELGGAPPIVQRVLKDVAAMKRRRHPFARPRVGVRAR